MNEKTIIAKLDVLLHQRGFVRRKTVWNRPVDHLVHVISVQKATVGDRITLNAGVLDREVYHWLWNDSPPTIVDDPKCTVRARIGELIDRKDIWWDVKDPSTGDRLVDHTRRYILPFLERMHSRGVMLGWLEKCKVVQKRYPQPIITMAILKHLLGSSSEARDLLRDLQKRQIGAWRQRAADILTRLG